MVRVAAMKRFGSANVVAAFACALGAGSSVLWLAPSLDLVAVVRWIDGASVDGWLRRVVAAVSAGPRGPRGAGV